MEQAGTFNGDFRELSRLMQASWAENNEEPLIYTEAFLRSMFQQPGASVDLCPALYADEALVGFIAAFPRTVSIRGKVRKLPIDSFLTVDPAFKQFGGLGMVLWRAMVDRLKESGVDGMISYCVSGDGMDQILLKIARHSRVPTARIFNVRYLARPVPKGRGPFAKADPDILLRAAQRLTPELEFARVWSEAEAQWQCLDRDGAFGCSLSEGGREGTISGYAMTAGQSTPVRCGLVDDVLWDGLDSVQRDTLVQRLIDSASAAGIELLLIPVMQYTDLQPFQSAGFRGTRRSLNVYLSGWNPEISLEEYGAAYIEVF